MKLQDLFNKTGNNFTYLRNYYSPEPAELLSTETHDIEYIKDILTQPQYEFKVKDKPNFTLTDYARTQKNPYLIKEYRRYFLINQNYIDLYDDTIQLQRNERLLYNTCFMFMDYDYLTEAESQKYKQILNDDPYAFLVGNSAGGTGLRAFYAIKTSIYDYTIYSQPLDDIELQHEKNILYEKATILRHHAHSLGLPIAKLDESLSKNNSQGSYSLSSISKFIDDIELLSLDKTITQTILDNDPYFKATQPKKYTGLFTTYSTGSGTTYNSGLTQTDTKTLSLLKDIMIHTGHTYRKTFLTFMKERCPISNYDIAIIIAIYKLDTQGRKLFYELYRNFYKGHTIPTNSFQDFYDYIQAIGDRSYKANSRQKGLRGIFTGSRIPYLDRNFTPLNDITPDKTYTITDYITEKATDLYNDFNINRNILLWAGAGLGKTTAIFNYIDTNYRGKKILFISLNNAIRDKLYNDADKLHNFKTIKIEKRNQHTDADITIADIGLLDTLSTIQYDLIVIDEIHRIIDYADLKEPKIMAIYYTMIQQARKTITMTATPFFYTQITKDYIIKIEKNRQKPDMNILKVKNKINKLYELIDKKHTDTITMIYYNDKNKLTDIHKQLKLLYPTKHIFMITSDTKATKSVKDIIDTETLQPDTIYLTTSFISTALNIINTQKIEIIVYFTQNSDIDDIYQYINRIRKYETIDLTITTIMGIVRTETYTDIQIKQNILNEIEKVKSYKHGTGKEKIESQDKKNIMDYQTGDKYINTNYICWREKDTFMKNINTDSHILMASFNLYFNTTTTMLEDNGDWDGHEKSWVKASELETVIKLWEDNIDYILLYFTYYKRELYDIDDATQTLLHNIDAGTAKLLNEYENALYTIYGNYQSLIDTQKININNMKDYIYNTRQKFNELIDINYKKTVIEIGDTGSDTHAQINDEFKSILNYILSNIITPKIGTGLYVEKDGLFNFIDNSTDINILKNGDTISYKDKTKLKAILELKNGKIGNKGRLFNIKNILDLYLDEPTIDEKYIETTQRKQRYITLTNFKKLMKQTELNKKLLKYMIGRYGKLNDRDQRIILN